MYAIADVIVAPAVALLQAAVSALTGANLVAAQGLSDPGAWLGPIALLGPGWMFAITSLLGGAALVVTLGAAMSAYRLYLNLKQGVKWW